MGTYARTARTGIVKLVSGGCRHFGLYVTVHQLAIAVCRTYCQKGNQYHSLIILLNVRLNVRKAINVIY